MIETKADEARITLSLRPGFEAAVAYFLETGFIWQGHGPPDWGISDSVSILVKMRDRDDAEEIEIPHGEPWELRRMATFVAIWQYPA